MLANLSKVMEKSAYGVYKQNKIWKFHNLSLLSFYENENNKLNLLSYERVFRQYGSSLSGGGNHIILCSGHLCCLAYHSEEIQREDYSLG